MQINVECTLSLYAEKLYFLDIQPEEAYGIDFPKNVENQRIGRKSYVQKPSKIIKIGTILGLVARHGLIFGGNEAYHFQEAF